MLQGQLDTRSPQSLQKNELQWHRLGDRPRVGDVRVRAALAVVAELEHMTIGTSLPLAALLVHFFFSCLFWGENNFFRSTLVRFFLLPQNVLAMARSSV